MKWQGGSVNGEVSMGKCVEGDLHSIDHVLSMDGIDVMDGGVQGKKESG